MNITNLQKKIYNDHLATSRKKQDKPFRIRKDFSKFDQGKLDILSKLERFFLNYTHINTIDYFSAPYEVFEDDGYFDLGFFLSSKAKKAYSQYMKKREIENPDSEESLKRLIDGLKFVKEFCKEKGLTLEDYPVYIESNLPCMVEHLKNHKINMYTLHALGVTKIEVENRILDFVFGNFWVTFNKTKNKFYLSKRMKEMSQKAIKKIRKQIK